MAARRSGRNRARLWLRLPEDGDAILRFRVGTLSDHERQSIAFKVNDRVLRTVFVAGDNEVVTLVVPCEIARRLAAALAIRFYDLEISSQT